MSDAPGYPRIWVHRILKGSRLVTTHPFDDADEYVRASLVLELLTAVKALEKDGWWAASESRFHAVRDAASKLKALNDE